MHLDQSLVNAAIALLEKRFPDKEGIAAAMYTEDGDILTSVYFEPQWGSAMLCAEAGAVCEAEKSGKRIVATACVSRLVVIRLLLCLHPAASARSAFFIGAGT